MTQPNRFSCTLLFALAAAALWAQPAPAPSPPASLKGFGEDSTFYLYVNEDRVGTIKVKWLPGGSYQNEATLAMAGQSMTVTTSDLIRRGFHLLPVRERGPRRHDQGQVAARRILPERGHPRDGGPEHDSHHFYRGRPGWDLDPVHRRRASRHHHLRTRGRHRPPHVEG